MNTEINEAAESLRIALTKTIVPLQTMRRVQKEDFEQLHAAACLVTKLLKGRDLVSKAILKELYACMQILRAEAPYHPDDKEFLERFAGKIEYCLGLILDDEDHSDRKPGVPRVF